jgi:predicted glycosyltransferase
LTVEYEFPPELAAKVHFTGYLGHLPWRRTDDALAPREIPPSLAATPGRIVLCMVGGGQDGAPLAEAFAQSDLPLGTTGVLVTGPFMPQELQQRLVRLTAANHCVRVSPFVADTGPLLERAWRVVAMGGYNTVCEVLASNKPALIVPRVHPRCEQLLRAERLGDLGLLDVLHPYCLSPTALTECLARDLGPRPAARKRIQLDGLAILPTLLADVQAVPAGVGCRCRPERRMHHVGL